METDLERLDRVRRQMRASGLDALLCRLPHNVLLLTGYAPVLGNSFVLFPLEEDPVLLVPESEERMAREGWVRDVRTFGSATLNSMPTLAQSVEPMLARLGQERRMAGWVIGYEHDYGLVPAPYCQFAVASEGTAQLLREALGSAEWKAADGDLEELESTLTEREIDMVRLANLASAQGVQAARAAIRSGVRECDVAAAVSGAVLEAGHRMGPVHQVLPFPHVISGPRVEKAYEPFSLTSGREIRKGELVLVQLEVCLDGFWAEVTRTFIVGPANREQRAAYDACLQAMERAAYVEHPGVQAAGVDIAARSVMTQLGYGETFRHGLGHGVGFQAISHDRPPRLHPTSPDILRVGMVHNVEPAVYMEEFGLRINDDVLVTEDGSELLTPLEKDLDWAICGGRRRVIPVPSAA